MAVKQAKRFEWPELSPTFGARNNSEGNHRLLVKVKVKVKNELIKRHKTTHVQRYGGAGYVTISSVP